jgi:hypothetical protein
VLLAEFLAPQRQLFLRSDNGGTKSRRGRHCFTARPRPARPSGCE